LGGSDAFIVLEDGDIPKAVAAGIKGRFSNAGQVCLAAKRFILLGGIADEFEVRKGGPGDPGRRSDGS
jgi:acyl-CoA reductase-like NAD-dependent aldehyde dehydrogenase